MKTVTFELQLPVKDLAPQWIRFIHEVNRQALRSDSGPVPFGSPILERHTSGVGIEVYAEVIVIHTDDRDRRDPDPDFCKGTAWIRFEATSVRLRRLFAKAVPKLNEAKPGFGLKTQDAGEWYAYQHLKAEALQLQIEAEVDPDRIKSLARQLASAENVGD